MSTWRMAMNFHFTDILQKEFFFFLHDSNECSNWIWISIICKCRKIMNAKVKMNMFIYRLYSTKLQAVCFHSAQDCQSNSNWTTFAIVSVIESGSLKVDGNWHLWSWLLLIETFSLAHLLCTTHCICVTMVFVTTIASSRSTITINHEPVKIYQFIFCKVMNVISVVLQLRYAFMRFILFDSPVPPTHSHTHIVR